MWIQILQFGLRHKFKEQNNNKRMAILQKSKKPLDDIDSTRRIEFSIKY